MAVHILHQWQGKCLTLMDTHYVPSGIFFLVDLLLLGRVKTMQEGIHCCLQVHEMSNCQQTLSSKESLPPIKGIGCSRFWRTDQPTNGRRRRTSCLGKYTKSSKISPLGLCHKQIPLRHAPFSRHENSGSRGGGGPGQEGRLEEEKGQLESYFLWPAAWKYNNNKT